MDSHKRLKTLVIQIGHPHWLIQDFGPTYWPFNVPLDTTVIIYQCRSSGKCRWLLAETAHATYTKYLHIDSCSGQISGEYHGLNAQKVYGQITLFTDLGGLLGLIDACLWTEAVRRLSRCDLNKSATTLTPSHHRSQTSIFLWLFPFIGVLDHPCITSK